MEYPKVYYLAHPYSENKHLNLGLSIEKTNRLLDRGYIIFNPIIHSHFLDVCTRRKEQFWYDFDFKFLEIMDGIIMSPGWKDSKGCRMEWERAVELELEILYYSELIE